MSADPPSAERSGMADTPLAQPRGPSAPVRRGLSLLTLGRLWVLLGFAAGLGAAGLWARSDAAWQAHLTRAATTGAALYETMRNGAPPPPGVTVAPLDPAQSAQAAQGRFGQIAALPQPRYVTTLSALATGAGPHAPDLRLVVVSGDLTYPVSKLSASDSTTPHARLGAVTRLMASYCSDPVLFTRIEGAGWHRVEAPQIWGCAAQPRDLRAPIALASLLILALLLAHVARSAESFGTFAAALRARRQISAAEAYDTQGPAELRDTVAAINGYLATERTKLAQRVMVLSGISHDLGTPATRLRLRAALIKDPSLRAKFEADIDSMTAMIESVLTYSQSELSVETPRQISLVALVEAIVADFQDMGKPVHLAPPDPQSTCAAASVFSARRAQGALPDAWRILATARPVLLRRALSNLIDNALKYGRSATVSLSAGADTARITVEDEGTALSSDTLAALTAPFARGQNAEAQSGVGLGLTIVDTIAQIHGGELQFSNGSKGLRATLSLLRS